MEDGGGRWIDWDESLSIYLAPKQNFRAGFKMFELKRKGCWLLRTCYRCYLPARLARSAPRSQRRCLLLHPIMWVAEYERDVVDDCSYRI
eukprot:scaffold1142_cov131-Skeletonema_dohrnii-CCMP3373.AAC.3